jgi:eukaryotic-like serine/threonine-protein kinase
VSDDTVTSLAGGETYCPACNRSYAEGVTSCPDDGTKLVRFKAQVDPLIGRILDERFEVRARIGRGGMGTVYRAWQVSVEREVAIKVIDPRLSHDRIAAKRFLREARLSSKLNQPSIVNVYDFGQTEDDVLFIAMELLRGRTLAQLLASGEPITVRRAITIATQLCDALEAAHGQGIVHRDLKPQNIVVLDDPPGRDPVKVLDFGLAKSLIGDGTTITHDDALLGTPLYMAPEVIHGHTPAPASDLYSLGCILYELLSGAPPFRDQSANAVLARHLSEQPRPLSSAVPKPMRALVESLLAKKPEGRPGTATKVREALQELLSEEDSGELDSSPISSSDLATTRAAAIGLAETVSGTSASLGDIRPTVPTPKSRRALWLVLLLVCAAGGVVIWQLASREPSDAAAPAIDAAPEARSAVPAADAAPAPDAAPVADADAAPAPDAKPRTRTRDRTPEVKPQTETDPGKGTGTGTGTGSADADPDVDFIPVPSKK